MYAIPKAYTFLSLPFLPSFLPNVHLFQLTVHYCCLLQIWKCAPPGNNFSPEIFDTYSVSPHICVCRLGCPKLPYHNLSAIWTASFFSLHDVTYKHWYWYTDTVDLLIIFFVRLSYCSNVDLVYDIMTALRGWQRFSMLISFLRPLRQ